MPAIGDIKRGQEVGIKDGHYFSWAVCPTCGKGRWIREHTKSRLTRLCRKCSNISTGFKRRGIIIGPKHNSWKGGRNYRLGYVDVWVGKDDFFYPMAHSRTGAGGYVAEHRLVVAKTLKRCLLTWETVHHKEGYAKDDNRYPESLELLPSPYKHDALTRMANHIKRLEKQLANRPSNAEIRMRIIDTLYGGMSVPDLQQWLEERLLAK